MSTDTSSLQPPPFRQPVHPSITEFQISQMVDRFYAEAQEDNRLGPIFAARVKGNWAPHLERMKEFWRSVLLRTGEYKGQPLPIHMAISEMKPEDFGLWLDMFRPAVRETFESEAASVVIEMAERIAQSLWLGQFASTPTAQYPSWLKDQTTPTG